MKFFSRKDGTEKHSAAQTRVQEPAVKEAVRQALDKYEKTFIDLARYDRGELVRLSQ